MKTGNLRQKANWFTVGFVFGCTFIIVILLIATVKSEAKAQNLDSLSLFYKYNPD